MKEDTFRRFMTFLDILVGVNVIKVAIDKLILSKGLKNIAYVRLQEEKFHQDSCLLEEDTFRRSMTFLDILVGVNVIKIALFDFVLSSEL